MMTKTEYIKVDKRKLESLIKTIRALFQQTIQQESIIKELKKRLKKDV